MLRRSHLKSSAKLRWVDGIHLAEQMQPTVVLLDIGLPGLDGIKAGPDTQGCPDAKIVFVSQEFDPDIIRAALHLCMGLRSEIGCRTRIVKAINTVVGGKDFVSCSVSGPDSSRGSQWHLVE